MSISRIEKTPTWLLARASSSAHKKLSAAFTPWQLRPVHFRVLAALHELGEMTQADLGRRLDLDRKDVATCVDLLTSRSLVSRHADPRDARRKIVGLDDPGRRLLPRLCAALNSVQQEVLAPLSPREATELLRLLVKMSEC
ncbi:MarR family winged helix-turn-helix transcriptional regulator [Gordonia polyisoprenivorans]|uniref:MarR family winged helix-turn-helix transcriptional regulator n=1 Tax=Gordonia polyisoprenivorans TaxID=84595 RepID=UPI001AD7BDF1|nr:MarR family winged helix-turn-helix transcriptional regulator [Gordonia polyisoprenivorans]QTI66975.1 winged helix-turn-helix transcriptional regulator [Gordonia polyisoprenivorans]